MNSVLHKGPPTFSDSGSFKLVRKLAPVDSVYPYPSKIGQQAAIFKKLITSPDIGAAAVTIHLTYNK